MKNDKKIEEEIWKDIVGYEGLYQVSSNGRVRSMDIYIERGAGKTPKLKKGIIRKLRKNNSGYLIINISSGKKRFKTYLVHRLVAIHFVENNEGKPNVNHKDGEKTNNNYLNLEWCTQKENITHAINTGLSNPRHLNRPASIFTKEEIVDIKKRIQKGERTIDIAAFYKVKNASISRIRTGHNYNHILI